MEFNKEHPLAWKFLRKYSNIPIPIRKSEIIALVDDEPMTFNVIYLEVQNKTKIGYLAIEQLKKIGVLE